MPEGGFCIEEVWEANRATMAEVAAALSAEREARRDRDALSEIDAQGRADRELRRRCEAAGVPGRYVGCPSDERRAHAMATGRGLWLWGPAGTGKTWAACAALKGWLSVTGRAARMTTSSAMLTALRDSMGTHDEARATAEWSRVPLLVLDDLGQGSPTPWAVSKLLDVVDARWGERLPTVVTSQADPKGVAALLASGGCREAAVAVVSRLAGSCEVVRTSGPDRRVHG